MASPVDTSVKFFTSDMPNAPVLNGTAGSLIALLGACLVDGFNAITLTSLVASDGVMTATWSSGTHACLPHSVVLISGVTGGPTGYADANGEQKVVSRPSSLTATWATDLPDGTYTGTISMKMAPAGWEWLFSDTNKGVLRSLSPERHGQVLRIDDTAAQNARVVAYESMSDVDTGAGPFPTNAQVSGGLYWWKAHAADANMRRWSIASDGRLFMLWIGVHTSTNLTGYVASMCIAAFGDLIEIDPAGSPYATLLVGNVAAVVGSITGANGSLTTITNSTGSYLARSADGVTSSQQVFRRAYVAGQSGSQSSSGADSTFGSVAEAMDGRFIISRMFVALSTTGVAPLSEVPGVMYIPQSNTYGTAVMGDTMDGAGEMDGRVLLAWPVGTPSNGPANTAQAAYVGLALVDIVGPWR